MNSSNILWTANLALEVACLLYLFRRQRLWSPLGVFVLWQVTVDVVATLPFTPIARSYFHWGTHAVTYLLIFVIFRPRRYDTVFGVYWIASTVTCAVAIGEVWTFHHRAQYELALVCGALAVFAILVGYISPQHVMLSNSAWAGLWLWSAGQIAAAALPEYYAAIYPATCAISLALFLTSLLRVAHFAPDRETILTRPTLYPIFQVATPPGKV